MMFRHTLSTLLALTLAGLLPMGDVRAQAQPTAAAGPATEGQAFTVSPTFPQTFVREQWNAGLYLTHLAHANEHWTLTMTHVPQYNRQSYAISESWEETYEHILEQTQEGFAVTDVVRGNGTWVVVMTRGAEIGRQRIVSQAGNPQQLMQDVRASGLRVTGLTFGDGRWVAVAAEMQSWGVQSWAFEDSYDKIRNFILDGGRRGRQLTDIAYGDGVWAAVMTAGMDRISQAIHRVPSQQTLGSYVEEVRSEGKGRLMDITHDGRYWWMLVGSRDRIR